MYDMKTTFLIGIDPGAAGAVAILEPSGKLVQVFDTPAVEVNVGGRAKRRVCAEMLAAELRLYAPGAQAVVEQVGAMPGQGVSSTFAFGQAFGLALGVLAGATVTVTPAEAKRSPSFSLRRSASALPTSAPSLRARKAAIDPSRKRSRGASTRSASAVRTPRNTTTSRLVRQLETAICIGTALRTPGIRRISSTYRSGSLLVNGQNRFAR